MISPEDIAAVAELADAAGTSDGLISELRRRWPEHHFTICLDEDIGISRPVREGRGYNLYLVAGGSGCIGFTEDAAAATGMVIAELEQEPQPT